MYTCAVLREDGKNRFDESIKKGREFPVVYKNGGGLIVRFSCQDMHFCSEHSCSELFELHEEAPSEVVKRRNMLLDEARTAQAQQDLKDRIVEFFSEGLMLVIGGDVTRLTVLSTTEGIVSEGGNSTRVSLKWQPPFVGTYVEGNPFTGHNFPISAAQEQYLIDSGLAVSRCGGGGELSGGGFMETTFWGT